MNTDSEDTKRIDALLVRVRNGYEKSSEYGKNRLKEGLQMFLCDIDRLEPKLNNNEVAPESKELERYL